MDKKLNDIKYRKFQIAYQTCQHLHAAPPYELKPPIYGAIYQKKSPAHDTTQACDLTYPLNLLFSSPLQLGLNEIKW